MGGAALAEPDTLGVLGVDVQRAALLALHERWQVVHPRVVRTQLAAADQQHLAVGRTLNLESSLKPSEIGLDRLGRQLDRAGGGAQHLGDARSMRPEVDAM